ncbi:MAG TPA: hypothetical protein VFL14_11520 [Xanthomonadales bacterium]|nr:hypothetical protein [Xanthomonadales bacterium]
MLRLLVAALAGAVVFFVGTAVIPLFDEPLLAQLATALFAFVGAPALVLTLWQPRSAVESARKSGHFQERSIEVVAAYQVEEAEDEGLHFFLEIAEGGTLFVSGQVFYEPVKAGTFPCEFVTLGIDTELREVLEVRSSGMPIPAGKPLPAFTDAEHEAGKVPDNLTEFRDAPKVVLAALGRTVA